MCARMTALEVTLYLSICAMNAIFDSHASYNKIRDTHSVHCLIISISLVTRHSQWEREPKTDSDIIIALKLQLQLFLVLIARQQK